MRNEKKATTRETDERLKKKKKEKKSEGHSFIIYERKKTKLENVEKKCKIDEFC